MRPRVCPWSPLAGGFLAGKYQREGEGKGASGQGRLSGDNPFGDQKFTDHNWRVLDALRAVSDELGRPLARVALAWASARPGVTAPILGARTLEQLRDNLASLDIVLTSAQLQTLDERGRLDPVHPYYIFTDEVSRSVFGGATVQGWR